MLRATQAEISGLYQTKTHQTVAHLNFGFRANTTGARGGLGADVSNDQNTPETPYTNMFIGQGAKLKVPPKRQRAEAEKAAQRDGRLFGRCPA